MNIRRLLIGATGILLLASCMRQPEPVFRPAGSVSGSAMGVASEPMEDVGETMPQGTDSLEVPSASGSAAVRTSLSGALTIIFTTAESSDGRSTLPTMTEWFDYDCEYCGQHAITNHPWIEKELIAGNRIMLERMLTPKSERGIMMAMSALCAADQGKFRQMDELLIADPTWDEKSLTAMAKKLKMKLTPFAACLRDKVLRDELESAAASIDRIPAFRLGNERWEGLMEERELQEKIEKVLK